MCIVILSQKMERWTPWILQIYLIYYDYCRHLGKGMNFIIIIRGGVHRVLQKRLEGQQTESVHWSKKNAGTLIIRGGNFYYENKAQHESSF